MNTSLTPLHQTLAPSFCAHRKVLFVDDKISILLGIEKTLPLKLSAIAPGDTFEIKTASEVEEAKGKIINFKPDIAIFDMQIDDPSSNPPDGIKLGKFARENGVPSIGFQTDSDAILRQTEHDGYNVMKKGEFEIIEKGGLFNPKAATEYLSKLIKKLHV